jgi:hypothetical protein
LEKKLVSRTIREIKITGKRPEEIKVCIDDWLHTSGFRIHEWDSKGRWINARGLFSIIGVVIRPHKGAIVATQLDLSGCIVFEISLTEDKADTILHGEFYAPVAEIFSFIELDLKSKPGLFFGKLPRESGYELMVQFLKTMEQYSEKPT